MSTVRPPKPGDPLTDRELEVLTAIAADLSNQETARRLGVSAGTVKSHMRRVCLKLGVQGRAGAVGAGYREGWLRLSAGPVVRVGAGAQR